MFANGTNMPRMKTPKTGPLTTPKMVTAAVMTPGTDLTTKITPKERKP